VPVVAPLNEENPSRAGYPWIAPQKLVDDLIGPAVRAALYAYAKEQGRDVISRPSLSVVPADSLEKHCEGGEANSF
jgi:hypothetical protein